MCWDPIEPRPEDTTGKCPSCGEDVDTDGISTMEGCFLSSPLCTECGDCPCDLSC